MRRLPSVLVLVLALVVSACGGSDADVETAADGAAEPTSTPVNGPIGSGAADDSTGPTDANGVVPTPSVAATPVVTVTPTPQRGGRAQSDAAADDATPPADSAETAAPDSTPTPASTVRSSATPPGTAAPSATSPAAGFGASTATSTPSPTATRPPPTVTPTQPPRPPATSTPTPVPPAPTVPASVYFSTLPPGSPLPSDGECAALVRADPSPETHPANAASNGRSGGPQVLIDGVEGFRGDRLAARISGAFTGTTDEILRWVACKWGFDEDITRARAWTESSWRVGTQGDRTDDVAACDYLGLAAPCHQSYGLLQVKGTVHEGTYPHSFQSTAWGVDYAMAWQRACYEGAFTWLNDQGYSAGDLNGCVGAWYSGEWYDAGATGYLADVQANLAARPWD